MLVSILLFQHYSHKMCVLLFSILCRHNRLRPSHQVGAEQVLQGQAVTQEKEKLTNQITPTHPSSLIQSDPPVSVNDQEFL